MKYVYTFILCSFLVRNVGCLQCLNCHDVTSPDSCQGRLTCAAGQSCYQQSRRTSAGTVYDMGCRDTAVCALKETVIVGRSVEKRQQADCHKCCSVDVCNDNICSFGTVPERFLLFTDTINAAVYRMDMDTQGYVKVASLNPTIANPVAVDYDSEHQHVYFTDVQAKLIIQTDIAGTGYTFVEKLSTSSVPDGLAIDAGARLLFYTDTGTNVISVVDLDSHRQTVIIDQGLDEPRGIVLDKTNRKMYWTDWGSVPKIEVANYDGSNRHMIITSGLRLPNAIALDTTGQTIYWADAGTTQIEKANIDGSNRQTLYTNTSSHFYGLALSGQYLYYTDWNAHSIMRLSVAGGAATEFGKAAFGRLNDVYAVSGETSSTGSNACAHNHAGCQHICLPLGNNGRTCVCQEGYTLQSDGTSCSSGLSVRLAGANSTSRGRIEISLDHGTTWGSVCDDRFDQSDANVICGMLGFSRSNAIPKNSSFFGPAETSYPILLDDIFCTGNEASILECSHSPLGLTDCDHNEDAGVICATEGQVYLSGSTSSNQGRIEIFLNGRWGTICDDNFGQTEANVVCGMLGFPRNGSVAKGSAYFGAGVQSESVHLDNVGCSGLETSVVNCAHSQVDTNNCGHREDVGVICPSLYPAQVRLTGGVSPTAGRVEISLDNGVTWGTICDDNFQTAEAGVVCSMLGYQRQGAITTTRFGSGPSSKRILLDDVNCRGSETNIIDCQHNAVGVNNCGHSEDVGVSCLSTSMADAQIRLVNGSSSREGRVEISVDAGTTWGTVCDDGFGNTEAGVVCAMIGYERGSAITKSISYFGKGSTSQHILLDDVDCTGSETNILACQHSPIGVNNCGHSEDVGVSCLNANNFRVRLVSGSTSHEGRVEVSDDGGVTWGTVCDDGFGDTNAGVVCHMLGYSRTGAVARGATVYGPGSSSSPILLDDVDCTSADTSIFLCRHNGIGVENCGHDEDVGVQCPSA